MISVADQSRIKLAMIRQLDSTLRKNYHQSLPEILNELRLRSVVSQPDPSPDKVFSAILETHLLSCKKGPSVARLRDAIERMAAGRYGTCTRCDREIPTDALLSDPTRSLCPLCQGKANR